MKQIPLYINNIIINTNNIYIYYGLFILFRADILLLKVHLNFVSAIKATIIANNNLDFTKVLTMAHISANLIISCLFKKRYQNLDLLTTLTFYFVKNILTLSVI